MKKKAQIFISSTYKDLKDERQAAVSAILKAGHIPAGMELFTAGDESQMETIKRWINESDIFMLILGGRYGSIEPTTGLSYTELEYDYAVNSGMPYFAVVIEESALEQKVKDNGRDVIETENTKQLNTFRKKVLSRTSAFFMDVQDIKLAVFETVSDFLARYEFKGWISGDEIPDIQSFTDQINKLREENKLLTQDRNALDAGAVFTPSEETEFNHIRQKLDREINIKHPLYKIGEQEKNEIKIGQDEYNFNLLSAIIAFVGKGYHRFSKSNLEHLLSDELNKTHPPTGTLEIKRGHSHGSIKDNFALELQRYGLGKLIEQDSYRLPEFSTCKFTEKMYRFVYWLEYNGYNLKIRFEFVTMTEEPISEIPLPITKVPALQTIKAIDRELNFKVQRNNWRTTEESVIAAQQEFEKLCNELEIRINKSNCEAETFNISFSREGQNQSRISSMGFSLDIIWHCEYKHTVDGSLLTAICNKTKFDIEGIQSFEEQQENYFKHEFDIDMDKNLKIVWKKRADDYDLITCDLAVTLLTDLVEAIHKRVAFGK